MPTRCSARCASPAPRTASRSRPPTSPWSTARAERYVAQLLPDLTHPHVHGANLGVRADAYLAVGGFDDLDLHEDHVLAARLREAGRPVVTTSLDPVVTSHRLQGRIDGGVATDLRSA